MKYKINWTELVGYYAIVEGASSPEQAIEWFEEGADRYSPEPDGYCEVEQDSIEAEHYFEPDEQLEELKFHLRGRLPNLEVTTDEGGQIVIYTGLKQTDQGTLIEHEPDES